MVVFRNCNTGLASSYGSHIRQLTQLSPRLYVGAGLFVVRKSRHTSDFATRAPGRRAVRLHLLLAGSRVCGYAADNSRQSYIVLKEITYRLWSNSPHDVLSGVLWCVVLFENSTVCLCFCCVPLWASRCGAPFWVCCGVGFFRCANLLMFFVSGLFAGFEFFDVFCWRV